MKILILTDVFFPDTIGGAGRVAYHLSVEISKRGHQTHIITRNPDNQYQSYQKFSEYLHVYRFPTPSRESIKLVLSEVRNSYLLTQYLISGNTFDLVCIHQCLAAIGPFFTGIYNRIPLIYLYHSPWHQEFLLKKEIQYGKCSLITKIMASVMYWTEKWVLSKASTGFVLSDYMLSNLRKTHRKAKTPILKAPAGVDLDHFHLSTEGKASFKTELKLPLDKTIFLTVRNLVPRMGIENLIEAFIRSSLLRNKSLLLVVGAGPLENHLRSKVESHNLKDTVTFLGRVSDDILPVFYRAADFFVLPTVNLEGFGLVILEAMACGTPVIGTPVGAIPAILGQFDKRLIFDGTGWKEIKTKLKQIVEKQDQYYFDPQVCRKFVEENFSWRKMADTFENEALNLI